MRGGRPEWVRVKSQLAYLPQELSPWHGSLKECLQFEAAIHGVRNPEDNEREVEYVIQRFSLGRHIDKSWGQLSGGYKLRFSLARVMVWKPKILVMDEPLANLDVVAQRRLLKDLRELARSFRYPMAVLMSSQHLHEMESVCKNIVVLRGGEVLYNGPTGDVGKSRADNRFEFGTDTDSKAIAALGSDARIRDVRHDGVSYSVRASPDLTSQALLQLLFDAGVQVDYFRDVSRSVKSLFE
jgi:ABC-2 type transport system ATP-binding protein